MAKTAKEITGVNLSHWAPGTRMFLDSDGQYFLVDADLHEYPAGPVKFVRRDTVVLFCNPDATVLDMVPDHVLPPGTTPSEAVSLIGYTLEGNG